MSLILNEGSWKPILVDFSLKSMKDKFCSSKKLPIACEQAPLFGRAKRASPRENVRASGEGPRKGEFVSASASLASTFQDIPQMESLLAGQIVIMPVSCSTL